MTSFFISPKHYYALGLGLELGLGLGLAKIRFRSKYFQAQASVVDPIKSP